VGEEIPLLARVLQVADVYDALRTTRPYKTAKSHEEACETMLQEAIRGLWDRELVLALFEMLAERRQAA
jgi:putative two-component system response regulator